jgi:hypothetical protein
MLSRSRRGLLYKQIVVLSVWDASVLYVFIYYCCLFIKYVSMCLLVFAILCERSRNFEHLINNVM